MSVNAVDVLFPAPQDGEPGAKGNSGQKVYPSGKYDANIEYKCTASVAPYVLDGSVYYVMNKVGTSKGVDPSNDYAANGENGTWIPFDMFKAVMTEVFFADFGKLASAVFSGDYMISQQGKTGAGADTTSYQNFNGNLSSSSSFIPNILLDFLTGFVKADNVSISGMINAISGYIGQFKIVDGDIIGTDINKIERLRLTTDAIPAISSLNSMWEIIDLGDGVTDQTGYCYRTDARDEYDTDQLVDTITAEYSENFNLPSIGNIRVDGCASSISLSTPLANGTSLSGNDVIQIWQGATFIATGAPDESIYVNASGNLTCKIISTITISGMGDGESYGVTIPQGYQGIVQQKASEKTLIGSNGFYSMFGTSKYLYFSKDYGFEVVMGNIGIQATTAGIKKWNGSSWVAVNW